MNEVTRRLDTGRLMTGLIITTVGVLFLLDRYDFMDLRSFWRLWPLVFVFIAVGKLGAPAGERSWNEAVFFLLLGGWFLAVGYHWWDLTYRNGWPFLIVIFGIALVVEALFDKRPRRGKEVQDG